MYRMSRNNLYQWLLASAILMALSAGSIIFGANAAACAVETAQAGNFAGMAAVCEDAAVGPFFDRSGRDRKSASQRVQWHAQKARSDAKRFSSRIKRHLGRKFATRREQFRRYQAQMERQRRAIRRSKARSKARQFAAARRRAAQHAPKHSRHLLGSKLKRSGDRKPMLAGRQGTLPNDDSNARPALHWRSHWRHGAHIEKQLPSD